MPSLALSSRGNLAHIVEAKKITCKMKEDRTSILKFRSQTLGSVII